MAQARHLQRRRGRRYQMEGEGHNPGALLLQEEDGTEGTGRYHMEGTYTKKGKMPYRAASRARTGKQRTVRKLSNTKIPRQQRPPHDSSDGVAVLSRGCVWKHETLKAQSSPLQGCGHDDSVVGPPHLRPQRLLTTRRTLNALHSVSHVFPHTPFASVLQMFYYYFTHE